MTTGLTIACSGQLSARGGELPLLSTLAAHPPLIKGTQMHRLLLLVAVLLPQASTAQTKFLSEREVRTVSEGIVASVTAGNHSGAWKELRPLSVFSTKEFDVFEAQFGSQHAQILHRFGSPLSYEHVRTEKLGNSLQRLQFIVRHEKAPMRWQLVFYRAEKGWVATDFTFDANVQALFSTGG